MWEIADLTNESCLFSSAFKWHLCFFFNFDGKFPLFFVFNVSTSLYLICNERTASLTLYTHIALKLGLGSRQIF